MKVPKENVLGKPGDGFRICMWQLNQTRLGCAAGALGVAGGALGHRHQVRQRTHPVRQADLAAPDDPGADRRDGGRAPGGADAGVPGRVAEGQRQAEPVRDLGRQVRGVGGRGARGERVHEDLRLVRLFDRVSRPSASTATPSRCRSWKARPTSRRSSSRAWPAAPRPTANRSEQAFRPSAAAVRKHDACREYGFRLAAARRRND